MESTFEATKSIVRRFTKHLDEIKDILSRDLNRNTSSIYRKHFLIRDLA